MEILRRELAQVEHPVHERLRGRHPHHVLAGLSDFGLEFLGGRLVLRETGEGECGQTQRQKKTAREMSCDHADSPMKGFVR
ncbi:hypothetical protein D3C83_35230 [compost metagenome]